MNPVEDAVRGRTQLVAPIVYRLAARLEQVPMDDMATDPATAAFVLRAAQSLFGLRMVVNVFTPGFESDDAQTDAAVDVLARLTEELRGEADVVGVLTGPGTLDQPDRELYAKNARRYADAGAAAVLVAERPGAPSGDPGVLGELANICRYFSVPSILLAPGSVVAPDAPVDLVLGGDNVLPVGAFADESLDVPARAGLLLTDDELPADTNPEVVTAWLHRLAGASR